MATLIKTYDPAKVRVVFGGVLITGYAPGSFVEYKPDDAVVQDAVGVDGEAARWLTNNPLGTLTLSLLQSADANFILSSFLNIDRLTLGAIPPVLLQDISGDGVPTRILAGSGWVDKQAVLNWQDGPAARTWTIRLFRIIHDVHGIKETRVLNSI